MTGSDWLNQPNKSQKKYLDTEAVYRQFVYENYQTVDQGLEKTIAHLFDQDEFENTGIYSISKHIRDTLTKYMKYDEKTNTFSEYKEIKLDQIKLYPLTIDKEIDGYKLSKIKINDVEFDALILDNSEYAVIHAQNMNNGSSDYYTYDTKTNTVVRYTDESLKPLENKITKYEKIIILLCGETVLVFFILLCILIAKIRNNKKRKKMRKMMLKQKELEEKTKENNTKETQTNQEEIEQQEENETKKEEHNIIKNDRKDDNKILTSNEYEEICMKFVNNEEVTTQELKELKRSTPEKIEKMDEIKQKEEIEKNKKNKKEKKNRKK